RKWDRDDRGAMPNIPTMSVADLEGKFRITGLRPGKYDIRPIDSIASINSPGAIMTMMQASRMMSFREDHDFEIRPGETTTIEIDTEDEQQIDGPSGQVTGTILLDGAPATRLSVMSWGNGNRKVVEVDPNGRFDLGRMPVGDHTLQVTEMPDKNSLSMRFSSLWSEDVKVEENQIHDVTIQISLSSASGYVSSTEGASLAGKQVTMHRSSENSRGNAWFHTTTDENGYFEFDRIPAGRYHVRAEDDSSRAELDQIVVEAGVPRADLRLALVRMLKVRGSVDHTAFGDRKNQWVWLRFEKLGPDGKVTSSNWVHCPGHKLTFETTDLTPGTYRIGINGPSSPDGQIWVHDGTVSIGATDVEGLVIRPILTTP
ncbi:MAG: carboxypeptidase regulatory-like domain-containing protein, partial [Planctomycetes bacterium]|nr:carboxypeptidase regulatory-like domain-containing protein [Planctomycetota bacterium]